MPIPGVSERFEVLLGHGEIRLNHALDLHRVSRYIAPTVLPNLI